VSGDNEECVDIDECEARCTFVGGHFSLLGSAVGVHSVARVESRPCVTSSAW
jgi:hypothetical protein